MTQTILVTGASSGLGQATATRLAEKGYTVYGTSRRALPDTPEGVRMRQLDVSDDASVQACVAGILEETGHVDVLINNAGTLEGNLIEEGDGRALFETNFWGQIRMSKALLPYMRQRGSGRIIYMGSMAGLISGPGMGYYSAAKHALKAATFALYHEVKPLGIDIVLVQPGYFATSHFEGFTGHIADYDAIRALTERFNQRSLQGGGKPKRVARLLERIIQARNPRFSYRIGYDVIVLPTLQVVVPQRLYMWGTKQVIRWRGRG